MRVLHGLQEAREFAAGRAALASGEAPREMSERIEAIFGEPLTPQEVVSRILEDVRTWGDAAVRDLTRRIDGLDVDELEVPVESFGGAVDGIAEELATALRLASKRVAQFAKSSLPRTWHDDSTGMGELVVPLERVGIYVPGGMAAYPSTVIMTAVVAKAAGVHEVVMCTPARDGINPNPAVLAAARIAQVDRVFRIGGAQAIAAMAYGTESVPKVDKICGPGNVFVSLAKQQLFGVVGIDGIYGPTETVVVADETADPALCAADLLAQAEHDPMAAPVLIATSETLLQQVGNEIIQQLLHLERRDVALAALNSQGAMMHVETIEEALDVANLIAPEHLCLNVLEPGHWIGRVRNAGGLFLGAHSAEVMGDYVAGPSHALPTHGTARFASYLGADQFVKRMPVIALAGETARELAPSAAVIARAEGFTGHARAADMRTAER